MITGVTDLAYRINNNNMKKISLVLLIVFTINILNIKAQSNTTKKEAKPTLPRSNTEASKNETVIVKKDTTVDSELSRIKKENKALKDTIRNLKDSIQNLTALIQKVNILYLKSVFIKIYMKDTLFLKTADIDDFDTFNINKTTVLSESLMLNKNLGDTLKTIKEVLVFNNNYIELFKINANVLSQKYDSIKVVKAIAIIDSLKPMKKNWTLTKIKNDIRALLTEYNDKTCKFKFHLDSEIQLNKALNTSISSNIFFRDHPEYKRYPYFIQILKDVTIKKIYKPEDLVCPSH